MLAPNMQRATAALHRLLAHMPNNAINNLSDMTDAALCSALSSLVTKTQMSRTAIYTLHSLVRVALRATVSDGRTRWPLFWTKGRCCRWTTGREACLENTLPWRMLRCVDAPVSRTLFERAASRMLIHSNIRRPSTGRKAFAFIWGFLVHPVVEWSHPLEGGTGPLEILGDCPTQWIVVGLCLYKKYRRGPVCMPTHDTVEHRDGPSNL
jgi:hypothetical protein